jgi:hypothetical protein
MTNTASCTISCLLICCFAFPFLAKKQDPRAELTNVLQQATRQRQEYVDLFKDLTAVETKTTELIDKDGKTNKQRTVISDFLVYASPIKASVSNEYRITREVDGKTVGKDSKQAFELFGKLAKAKTLEQEGRRLREENLKHTLYYYRWGITLSPIPQLQIPSFSFQIVGREKVEGRETIVLRYQRQGLEAGRFEGLLKKFKDPRSGNRGRIWLDAEDSRIWRWENETTVVDRDIPIEAPLTRDEVEYEPSAFGINIPKKIVTLFFDKKETDKQRVRLAGRITYTYQSFKRFDVKTDYEIQKPDLDRPRE